MGYSSLTIQTNDGWRSWSSQNQRKFCEALTTRARVMSNEMIKIDLLVSSALELKPDIDRIARAENFVEDGKIDTRRD